MYRGGGNLARPLGELPVDGDFTLVEGCNGFESGDREIDRVSVVTCGAGIGNGHGDLLVVRRVRDLDLLSAEVRLSARVAITVAIDGGNEVVVAVDSTACTSDTILVEESSA